MEENQAHIPEGWSEDSLGNILNYEQPYNYTVDSTEYNDSSGIPVLTAGKSFILGYTNEYYDVYRNTPVIIFDDFTTDSKFVDFPFKVKSSAMKFLKPKNPEELDIQVIFGHIQNLKIRETGGDHKRRWISEFSKLKVALPPFHEQTQIANILSKVDEAITQTEQLIAKYTRIKTGLMQDLLTKGIDENGNIRSEETHEFKDSPLGRIPKEWECEKLGVIGKVSRGKFTPRPRNNLIYYGGNYPFIQTGDISNCKSLYLDSFTQTLNEKGITVSKKFPKGTIVMTIAANIGDTAILSREMYLTDSVVGIVSTLNEIYLELFFRSIKRQLENTATQSAQKNINIAKLNEVYIKYPISVDEQKQIVSKYLTIGYLINDFQTQLSKLQSLKTGLMQDLLSGQVRVNHLIKETANV